ncbi:cysteine-rich receptor-like protein kinase 29 [Diospyros lotus]|uniref:cysteine-rich receptor-like protein kinase 29 n=1 Tax=Diospyros lotus TaxID=55363 RepID=UPI002255651F|nr:cysteine-rich receptor-like protein kinase 29 [Diospyros lotus]
MESHCSRFLLFFLFNSLIKSFTITSGDPSAFIKCYCSEAGNYTIGSPFKENLNLALSYLPSNTSLNNGFYNVSVGQTSDIVYAISYCRGDVLSDICRSCVYDSVQEIFHCCPNQMEALGFYDYCMLRYSNRYIFGVLETQPRFNWSSEVIVNSTNQFEQELESLLNRLVAEAAWQSQGKKFAVGQLDMTYALVQCSEDLSSLNCSVCLDSATNDILNLYGWETGAQIHMPSCNIRFEVYKFYNSTPGGPAIRPPSNAPPPPPTNFNNSTGKGGSKILVKVAIGVGACAGAGGLLAVLILVRSRDNSIDLIARTEYGNISSPFTNIESPEANGSGRGSEAQLYDDNAIIGAEANPPSEPDEVGKVLEAQPSGNHVIAGEIKRFQLSSIKAATNDFAQANVLGRGAYGVVYKATLPDGQEIAVKRLKLSSCNDDEFKNELSVLAKLEHENLVKFLGFCLEGTEKILVFEFVKNGSLDKFIFERGHRQWERLHSFILGIVGGLLYLHRDFGTRIIHRDIKPANILLSESMEPKIADFGMAKLFRDDQTHCESSKIKGTFGYLAPEYANCRRFSARSDVYSFGVLVLEIVSGRRNNSADPGVHLLSCAWISLMRNDRVSDLYDPSILGSNPSGAIDQIKRCIHIGLLCVQANEALRPEMEEIDTWLKDSSIQLPPPLKPPFFVPSDSEMQMSVPIVGSSTSSSTSGYQSLPSHTSGSS